MAFNPEWHRAYAVLENAELSARIAYRSARGAVKKAAAMDVLREAGRARFEYEMAGATIVDISTLPVDQWAKAMLPG